MTERAPEARLPAARAIAWWTPVALGAVALAAGCAPSRPLPAGSLGSTPPPATSPGEAAAAFPSPALVATDGPTPGPTATPSPSPTPSVSPTPTDTPTPPPEASWPVLPVIDGPMKARLRAIYDIGQSRGHRPGVFIKVGDSHTASGAFLTDLGCGLGNLGEHADLAPSVTFFMAETLPARPGAARCGSHNAFTRRGVAVGVGWSAVHLLRPIPLAPTAAVTVTQAAVTDPVSGSLGVDLAPTVVITTTSEAVPVVAGVDGEDVQALCAPPLDLRLRCEVALTRPSIALVMLGTNDLEAGVEVATYAANLGRIVDELATSGVIPVLSTIPPRLDKPRANAKVSAYNQAAQAVSMERGLPLWNLWRQLDGPDMVHRGLAGDGIHLNFRGYGADFSAAGLRYGHNQRSLGALRVLDALRRIVIEDGPPEG